MHDLWIALIAAGSTLGAAGLGAWLGARFTRRAAHEERESQRRRDLETALAAYYSATVKAVAAVSRLPNVDPEHWFHELSSGMERMKDWLFGPTVGFVQTERGMHQVFGQRPFRAVEDVIDAGSRLLVVGVGAELSTAMDAVYDYLIELGSDRSQEQLDRWPDLRRTLLDAITAELGRAVTRAPIDDAEQSELVHGSGQAALPPPS